MIIYYDVEYHAADFYDEDDIDEEELRELDEPDEEDDSYESEEDVARGEGFYIDDDGEWRPLDDEDDW